MEPQADKEKIADVKVCKGGVAGRVPAWTHEAQGFETVIEGRYTPDGS